MGKNLKCKLLYSIIFIEILLVIYILLRDNYILNSITLSKIIEFLIIIMLIGISVVIIKYIRNKFNNNKYSYDIITALGFLLFIIINAFRHAFLLIADWSLYNKYSIYNNTLESFSGFIILTLPCIIILAIYSIISNVVLIRKEGKKLRNLLGIFIGVLAIIGLFGSQMVYYITTSFVSTNKIFLIKYITDVFINSTLVYLYSILLATLYCNIKASRHIPKFDKDYVIILGCMIKKDGSLTPLLRDRVDKAVEFSKMQKEATGRDIVFIPSGGQGDDEVISEAEAMKNYLLKKGIKKKSIIVENKSKNTLENMKFSYEIMKKKMGNICFSTTSYHVFRSGVTANNIGMDCEGMGSKTKWYFNTNALIREFIADLVKDKKKHIIMLIIIYFFAVLLVLIGYYYKLINFY